MFDPHQTQVFAECLGDVARAIVGEQTGPIIQRDLGHAVRSTASRTTSMNESDGVWPSCPYPEVGIGDGPEPTLNLPTTILTVRIVPEIIDGR